MHHCVKPLALFIVAALSATKLAAAEPLPIADAHVHYSHDSVELTPPARVIELMREANLKFALVSSSDDNGTQLLSELAPDLIIPGLRPYRRRGELSTWFKDQGALDYVERLLNTNTYATIGEFHLYGADVELDIPKRIVELADEYNLVLHAHSDADAVARLLAQSPTVKVIWAHSGFDSPPEIADMLRQHDRLWADLAFRSEVGSGGSLSEDWVALFEEFPDRMMLGTDTYTPERMYFLPDHAESARVWLASLPAPIAERVAWKNAYDLLMPIWNTNRAQSQATNRSANQNQCKSDISDSTVLLEEEHFDARIDISEPIVVSQPFQVKVSICGDIADSAEIKLDAGMPSHGHGMNYSPQHKVLEKQNHKLDVQVDGLVMHMPGVWRWDLNVRANGEQWNLIHDFTVQ